MFYVQNSYLWDKIKRSFETSGVDDYNLFLFVIISILIVVIIISIIIWFINTKFNRSKKDKADGVIKDKSTILSIFQIALNQRCRFDVYFEGTKKEFYCSLVNIKDQSILLEVPIYTNPSKLWLNRNIVCHFKISLNKRNNIYYKFRSKIVNLILHDKKNYLLELLFPDKLKLCQKRRHLRFEPPHKYVVEIIIWRAVYSSTGNFEGDINQWGIPLAKYDHTITNQLRLIDISAGGLRIQILKKIIGAVSKFIKETPFLFLKISLSNPDKNGVSSFFILGKIINYYQEVNPNFVSFGINFIALGKLKDGYNDQVLWLKIDDEIGIEEIGDWVFKRHLEFYREKGLI